jgi:phosphatidylglycerophosphate synthase
VARRRDEVSAFGARFDMELDALLILVLCLWLVAAGVLGYWVLALGAMRYAFVLAAVRWPYLAEPLPQSRRRKLVCVVQVAALLVAITPAVGEIIKVWTVAGALAALTLSFAVDVAWLYRHANR